MNSLISYITILTALVGAVTILVKKCIELKRIVRPLKCIIGIVGQTPECLIKYPDFTSYEKALASPEKTVILHCKTLSYSLRKCDFVCADAESDPKIRKPDDEFWLNFSE